MGDEKPKEDPRSRSFCGIRDFAFGPLKICQYLSWAEACVFGTTGADMNILGAVR